MTTDETPTNSDLNFLVGGSGGMFYGWVEGVGGTSRAGADQPSPMSEGSTAALQELGAVIRQ